MTKVYVYVRVSTMGQDDKFSPEAQRKLLYSYVKEKELSVVQEFYDVETAKKVGRSQFGEMLAALRESKDCRTIIVEKTDRLYRNLKDWINLDDLDVEIHFVKEGSIINRDSHSSEKFIHGVKVLMAKNYIENLSEETRKGMLEKASQGEYPTRAPFGYRNNKETQIIEPNPETSGIIPMLYEEYSTGKFSLIEVRKKLAESWPAMGAKIANMPKSTIHRILQNPAYFGEFYWNKKLFKGTYPPLISRELWEQVQRVLHRQNKPHPQKRRFAFTGLLNCGYCGSLITAEIHKGRYVYYRCTEGKGKCAQKYIREERIADLLGECIKRIEIGKDVVDWLASALKESHMDEKAFHDEQIAKLRGQYNRLQSRLEQMYDDKLDGKITQELYEHKAELWHKSQDEMKRSISDHENADRNYINQGIQLLRLSTKAYSIYQKLDLFEKRNLLDFVLSNSILKDEIIQPNYREPFNILANTNAEIDEKRHLSQGEMPVCTVWGPFLYAFRTFCYQPNIELGSPVARIDDFFPEQEALCYPDRAGKSLRPSEGRPYHLSTSLFALSIYSLNSAYKINEAGTSLPASTYRIKHLLFYTTNCPLSADGTPLSRSFPSDRLNSLKASI